MVFKRERYKIGSVKNYDYVVEIEKFEGEEYGYYFTREYKRLLKINRQQNVIERILLPTLFDDLLEHVDYPKINEVLTNLERFYPNVRDKFISHLKESNSKEVIL